MNQAESMSTDDHWPVEETMAHVNLRFAGALLVGAVLALFVSAVNPYDRVIWWEEISPILIVWFMLLLTGRRYPLSRVMYLLIFMFSLMVLLGAHYSYARVPLGDWITTTLGLARNDYDRIAHAVKGGVLALMVREILLRRPWAERGAVLVGLSVAVALAASALWEMVEWAATIITGSTPTDFLGTQGDIWDSHWDMLSALLGATVMLAVFSRAHDRSLRALRRR